MGRAQGGPLPWARRPRSACQPASSVARRRRPSLIGRAPPNGSPCRADGAVGQDPSPARDPAGPGILPSSIAAYPPDEDPGPPPERALLLVGDPGVGSGGRDLFTCVPGWAPSGPEGT